MNSYSYGDFRGDESEWMAKYFDAFLYMANWGTHRFMLRLPGSLLPLESVGATVPEKRSRRVPLEST